MILVDTSVWIELLSKRHRLSVAEDDMLRFVTCGPIVQEVLQGLRPGVESDAFREAFLAIPVVADPLSLDLFLSAADIYSHGRRRGLTIRSAVDCLIAAIAIEQNLTVWHRDRDFSAIGRYTALRALQR
jgi:predicted nucleic acid-binding protein